MTWDIRLPVTSVHGMILISISHSSVTTHYTVLR